MNFDLKKNIYSYANDLRIASMALFGHIIPESDQFQIAVEHRQKYYTAQYEELGFS